MPKRSHILVVDDHAETLDLLTQLLEGEYRVTTATNGREAIAAIARERPDLLILDLLMPVCDGFAVLRHLEAHPGAFLPVIVRSAVHQRDARLKALKMGAHEFLGTPFDEEELGVRIRTLLALKEARAAAELRADALEATVAERTRALRLAVDDLREADRYKDEFLSVISHELRTPLSAIIGYADTLEDGLAGELTEGQHAMVRHIVVGGQRMLTLVNNLLDMSRMAAGKFGVQVHAERYEPIVEQALAGLRSLAAERGVTLVTDLRVPEPVELDEPRTVQLLRNLIENAIKFSDAGGEVLVRAFLRDGDLITEVTDTGIGIAPDDQARLFKQFKQVDMSSTREVGGSGLGLRLAKGIVEAHGGRIGVRSAPGEGSTFWFRLPGARVEIVRERSRASR